MIRQDHLSKVMIVLALMGSVYLATFETTTLMLFPGILLIFGLVMEIWLEKKQEYVNHITQPKTMKEIGTWTIMAIFGILLVGYVIDYAKFYDFSVTTAVFYGILMAVAEEQFFRGFITDFLVSSYPDEISLPVLHLHFPGWLLALLSSAGIFTMYHFARYGGYEDTLLYVMAGGFILSTVAWKSRRISPCMLAHVAINILAFVATFTVIGVL